jgi:hypothetical protein
MSKNLHYWESGPKLQKFGRSPIGKLPREKMAEITLLGTCPKIVPFLSDTIGKVAQNLDPLLGTGSKIYAFFCLHYWESVPEFSRPIGKVVQDHSPISFTLLGKWTKTGQNSAGDYLEEGLQDSLAQRETYLP